jgi:predicted ATPase/transcriptional regulator with XRE-family HTH domain
MQVEAQASIQDGKVILNPDQLKALRKQRGLSQDALAQLCMEHRLCVSIASIKRAETGKPVLYRTASHLARVYARELDELVQAPAEPALAAAGQDASVAEEQRHVLELRLLLDTPVTQPLADKAGGIIAQYGGQQQQPGLAVFGVPRAYGSDAVRCLQCATALAQLFTGYGGAVVVRSRQWPASDSGDEPRPSMLASLPARVGPVDGPAVFAERSLATQTGERFVFAPTVYADGLLHLTHERHGLQIAQYPLIGRHVEVRQFKATLETTLAYQGGHILYLRGVAGIGKSRLIQEFTEIALQNEVDAHTAVVLDFGVRGDATPLAQLVRSLLGLPPAEVSEDKLGMHLRQAKLPEDLAMHFRTILGMPQPSAAAAVYAAMAHETRERRQVEAVRELILRRAVERPLLLVVEDIHWSSPELMATLAALLPDVQEAPIIWLLSSRFEQDPFEQTLRPWLNGLPVTMLDLASLRAADALAMARHAGDPDQNFHEQCVTRAQGNPLFLTQLLLAGRGQALPGSLANLVQTKLDQLPAPQRRALRVASAIGQYFSLGFLRDVLQQPDHDLLDCVRQYIVRPTERDNYVFVHDLVMQGIYESIPPAQRAEIHVALASQYSTIEPRLRARHLHKARHPDAPGALLDVIADYIAGYQYHPALDLIETCQRIDYAPRDEYRLQLLSGQCHAKMGHTGEARSAFAAALELAPDQARKMPAVIGLATALNVLEDLRAEEALLDGAIADATAAGVKDGLGELYYLKGNIYFPRGDFAMSRQLHEQAQRHARSRETEARALSGIGDSYYAQGRMVTAQHVFRECLDLCEKHGLAEIEASNRFMLGTTRIYLNQTSRALEDALASAELGSKVGNRRAEIVSRLTAGWALLSTGQAAQARAQVEQGLDLARKIGASRFEPFLNESMVRVLLLEDQPRAAHELALQAWDAVERLKLHKFIGPWVLSTLALVEPDGEASAAALERGLALLEQGCVAHNLYRFHVSAMETRLLHGQPAEADALADRFEQLVAQEPCPWASHHIALARGSAAWLEQPSSNEDRLRELVQSGEAAGLGWVMPLWRQRLSRVLHLD